MMWTVIKKIHYKIVLQKFRSWICEIQQYEFCYSLKMTAPTVLFVTNNVTGCGQWNKADFLKLGFKHFASLYSLCEAHTVNFLYFKSKYICTIWIYAKIIGLLDWMHEFYSHLVLHAYNFIYLFIAILVHLYFAILGSEYPKEKFTYTCIISPSPQCAYLIVHNMNFSPGKHMQMLCFWQFSKVRNFIMPSGSGTQ